jgi:hypothetical protein
MVVNIIYRSKHKNIKGNEENIITKYLEEWSSNKLAKLYKVNIDTILRVLKNNNISVRTSKDARNLQTYNITRNKTIYKKFSSIDIDDMIDLYSVGYGINYISSKYCSDNSVIIRILTNKGIHIRNKQEQNFYREKTTELFKQTIISKYGGWTELQKMHKAAVKSKYGVDNVMQIYDVFNKQQRSSLKIKHATIDGVDIQYQGYELKAIKYLIDIGIKIDDIVIGKKDIPTIKYNFKGLTKIYFPDIYIPTMNHIFEVKSQWTLQKEYEQNIAKKEACIKEGYLFDFLIF